jgi:hypothetical protein
MPTTDLTHDAYLFDQDCLLAAILLHGTVR